MATNAPPRAETLWKATFLSVLRKHMITIAVHYHTLEFGVRGGTLPLQAGCLTCWADADFQPCRLLGRERQPSHLAGHPATSERCCSQSDKADQ